MSWQEFLRVFGDKNFGTTNNTLKHLSSTSQPTADLMVYVISTYMTLERLTDTNYEAIPKV